jgi:hypothetical protein
LFIVEYYFALKPFAGVMRYWVHPDASTSYTHQNNTPHTIHTATVINILIRRATENRGNVTNLIYISGTCLQDVDVCDLQTVLKDSTIILTSKKGPKTNEAEHRKCIK